MSKSGTQPQRGGPMAAQAIGLGRSPSAEPSQPQRGGPTAAQAIGLGEAHRQNRVSPNGAALRQPRLSTWGYSRK